MVLLYMGAIEREENTRRRIGNTVGEQLWLENSIVVLIKFSKYLLMKM